MSSRSSQRATTFYSEVAANKSLWTIRDNDGFPAPKNAVGGARAMPFWSSLKRVRSIIATHQEYSSFEPVELSWEEFKARWVPGLMKDGILVGLNWSGPRVTGYDVPAVEVEENIEKLIRHSHR